MSESTNPTPEVHADPVLVADPVVVMRPPDAVPTSDAPPEVVLPSATTFHQAYDALNAFAQNFAAPILALLPVLERVKAADYALSVLEPEVEALKAQADDLKQQAQQATIDKQTVLDSIEHERSVRLEDVNRNANAYAKSVQTQLDGLAKQLADAQISTTNELTMLATQIEQRATEQRELDADINQKKALLAELNDRLARAKFAAGG